MLFCLCALYSIVQSLVKNIMASLALLKKNDVLTLRYKRQSWFAHRGNMRHRSNSSFWHFKFHIFIGEKKNKKWTCQQNFLEDFTSPPIFFAVHISDLDNVFLLIGSNSRICFSLCMNRLSLPRSLFFSGSLLFS